MAALQDGQLAYLYFLIILVCVQVSFAADTDWYNENTKLRQKLLVDNKYDKMSLPPKHNNGTTTVQVGMLIRGIHYDEDRQILHIYCWIRMSWMDERLTWDYKDYGLLERFHVSEDEIWHPDITLYNNAEITDTKPFGVTNLLVSNDGNVIWVPPAELKVECPMDLSYWPYDSQKCTLMFGSWSSHGWQLNMELHGNVSYVFLQNLKFSYHWKIEEATWELIRYQYVGIPEPYVEIWSRITVKRVSPSFASFVIIPALCISLLTLVQFLLPLVHPQRLTVGCCCCLLTLVMLVYCSLTLPVLSNSTPIIVKFYGQTLCVIVLSIALISVIQRLAASSPTTAPPAIIKNFLTGPASILLCLQQYVNKVGKSYAGSEDSEVLEGSSISYADEWLLLAAALDRLATIVFIIIFVITMLAYVAPL